MPDLLKVVIYGNSLPLAGIAVAIQDRPELQVTAIHSDNTDMMLQLNDLHPDVIIFDQDQGNLHPLITRFTPITGICVIGIDANNNQMSVWSGRKINVKSIFDLLQTIHRLSASEM